jgi:hypothetical protein
MSINDLEYHLLILNNYYDPRVEKTYLIKTIIENIFINWKNSYYKKNIFVIDSSKQQFFINNKLKKLEKQKIYQYHNQIKEMRQQRIINIPKIIKVKKHVSIYLSIVHHQSAMLDLSERFIFI